MNYDIENLNKNKKKRNEKIIKKLLDIIIIILLYNIILVFISCINKIDNMSLFGYKAYIVITDSMTPAINVGDVIITKKVKSNKIEIGDVITFKQNQKVITHRITNIEKDNENNIIYTTKGDNNNLEDSEKVKYENIEGKNILTIPKLGYIINILENQIVFLLIVLILLILLFFRIVKEEKMENRRKKKKIEQEKRKKN